MSTSAAGVVIVGAGQAGYQCAESLRKEGYEGVITLIGDEEYPPYQRPPLSKSYLLGELDKLRLQFRARDYYAQHDISLLTGTSVKAIDAEAHRITLANGDSLQYSKLVLSTGASVRRLNLPGAEAKGICYLKTIDDIERIEEQLAAARKIVIIGTGFIGLEFAAVARKLDKQVQVLGRAERLLDRVVSPLLSNYFHQLHSDHGVAIAYNQEVQAIELKDGKPESVLCADGSRYPADMVLVGIGSVANTELAAAAGVECGQGIVVDEDGASSEIDIYAAGDCSAYHHPYSAQSSRLESVQNAVDQARAVAAHIAGHANPYNSVPWFWSDQYDSKLQIVGLSEGCDEVLIRGDMASGKFSLFHYRKGELRAIDSINKPADHMLGRKLLAAGISPTAEQVVDTGFALKSLLN